MRHPSGVVLNLLGPADMPNDKNILMDVGEKYPGITHVSFKVASIEAARQFLAEQDIALSGQFTFKDLQAVFIRDPDRNVIELDAYTPALNRRREAGAKGRRVMRRTPDPPPREPGIDQLHWAPPDGDGRQAVRMAAAAVGRFHATRGATSCSTVRRTVRSATADEGGSQLPVDQ